MNRDTASKHGRECYNWKITGPAAVQFVDSIYPYLVVKRNQALLLFGWSGIRPAKNKRWPTDALEACALIEAQSKFLNRKGPSKGEKEPMIEFWEAMYYAT